ncbi:hypothetical protein B0H12DRAFT_855460 [Mycena haematopus]|nr:hypothetical protein B0H12DRAFT_855460 [Mycena haematopus]
MNVVPSMFPPQHRQTAPLNWIPQQSMSPTSASPVAPPPGYGPYAASVGVGFAGPSSHRPGSSGNMSAGHRTPTALPPSPMSELPLTLQNFTNPAMAHAHPQTRPHPQTQHPHSGRARTASSGSASSALRTQSQPQSPAQPPPLTHMPATIHMPAAPAAFVTRDGHMVRAALPPERRASMEMSVDGAPRMQVYDVPQTQLHGFSPDTRVNGARQPPVGNGLEPQMDIVPETQMDVAPQMQDSDAPSEIQDLGSPSEAHEAVTPPLDASSTFAIAVADASPGVNGDRSNVACVKEEEPAVKMEVDDDAGGGADEEEEDDDENDEDYVEVGPDGLRSVKSCVTAIFDAERNYVCRFCE